MRGGLRRGPALAAVLLFCLVLSACGGETMTAFDATAYVGGVLDETYKGSWNNAFLDLMDLTDGEAQDAYQASLREEYRRFAYQFSLNDDALTVETREDILELLAQVCARAQYSVKEAVALDETRYAVEVSVRPMDLFLQVREDALEDYQTAFAEKYAGAELEGLSGEEREAALAAYENDWAQGIAALCRDRLGLMNHLEVVPILVLVSPDENGLYGMGDNDFSNLSALIIPY